MAASTTLLTHVASAKSTGPSAASKALAIAAAGPIQDLAGNIAVLYEQLAEAKKLVTQIIAALDSGDGIKTTLTDVQSSLS